MIINFIQSFIVWKQLNVIKFQTNIDVDIRKIINLGIPEVFICGNEKELLVKT